MCLNCGAREFASRRKGYNVNRLARSLETPFLQTYVEAAVSTDRVKMRNRGVRIHRNTMSETRAENNCASIVMSTPCRRVRYKPCLDYAMC